MSALQSAGEPAAHRQDPALRGDDHIVVTDLNKAFNGAPLYKDFNLTLRRGAFVSVFGPNGCGKSTLINMMAGILPMDSGHVLFDGRPVSQARIGYVFQNYREAVFPWLRAIDNIRYPLKFLPISDAERQKRIDDLLKSFDVKLDLSLYPYQMSGGQQQLVSIMRALVVDPEVLFLDEPFSALDYEMTLFLREKLQRVLDGRGVTTLLVSHDLDEAVYMADEVLLLTKRPTRVAERIPFSAPRPRVEETTVTPDFIRTKARSLAVFQREVRK